MDNNKDMIAIGSDQEQVSVGKPQSIDLPIDRLSAALVCASTDDKRPTLNGIFVHQVEGVVRMVSADGERLFVASHTTSGELPAWLDEGLIIPGDQLKARLGMLSKGGAKDYPFIKLTFAMNGSRMEISDGLGVGENVFRLAPVWGKFPAYQTYIARQASSLEGHGVGDMHQIGFNPAYLKHVGEISKVLKADGVVVYGQGSEQRPSLFTFNAAPGVVLYMQNMRISQMMATDTVLILDPAIKGTLAALKAHVTRDRVKAEAATSDTARQLLLARVEGFQSRINAIMARTAMVALPAPKPGMMDDDAEIEAAEAESLEASRASGPAEVTVEVPEIVIEITTGKPSIAEIGGLPDPVAKPKAKRGKAVVNGKSLAELAAGNEAARLKACGADGKTLAEVITEAGAVSEVPAEQLVDVASLGVPDDQQVETVVQPDDTTVVANNGEGEVIVPVEIASVEYIAPAPAMSGKQRRAAKRAGRKAA